MRPSICKSEPDPHWGQFRFCNLSIGPTSGENSKPRKRRVRRKELNVRGQEKQHFLLASAAVTLSQYDIGEMTHDEAYETLKAIRFAENDGEPFCAHCGFTEVYEITTRRIFKCAACRKTFSVTSKTIFASSKLPIKKLLMAVLSFVNGASGNAALRMRRDIGLSYKAAFVLGHKMREAVAESRTKRLMQGEVEADGVILKEHHRKPTLDKIGGRKNRSGQRYGDKNALVVVAVRERGPNGESRVKVVPRNEVNGTKFIMDTVSRASILITDEGWPAILAVFEWKTVNHSIGRLVNGVHTNGVESLFSRMRRAQRGVYYNIRNLNLDLYAEEVSFREDYRRKSNGEQFRMVIYAATHHPVSRRFKGYWQRHLS